MREGVFLQYYWSSTGLLLARGACIFDDYQKHFPPEYGTTKVYSTIETQKVRDVDAKKKTLTIDFILTMRWLESRIKTNFARHGSTNREIILGPAAVETLWSPDLHILNRKSFQIKDEWATLITTRLLASKDIDRLEGMNSGNQKTVIPTVEMKYEVKTTVFCEDWTYIKYPMDSQTCDVKFGSSSASSIFKLFDKPENKLSQNTYEAVNFKIQVRFFDQNHNDTSNHVGIRIKMTRLTISFILKYYAPCIAIVLVSEIGFVIPASAIPGRVSLLVTQFLTIINLFIYQMVGNLNHLNIFGILISNIPCKCTKDVFFLLVV